MLILLGTGSTLVTLPLFSIIFPSVLSPDISIHFAIGTCIAVNSIGALMLAISNYKSGNYDKNAVIKLTIPAVIGALISPHLIHFISPDWAKCYVGGVIISISLFKFLKIKSRIRSNALMEFPGLKVGLSFIIALIAGTSGISMGILMIPFLSKSFNHRKAVGTSAIIASIYSIIAAGGYALLSHGQSVPYAIGDIYLPAFVLTSITIIVVMKLGLKSNTKINDVKLKNIFYGTLIPIGGYILISGIYGFL